MAVKAHEEQPAHDDERPRQAALFSRRLARQQTSFEQFVAWLLLIISFVSSVLLGGGRVDAWVRWQPNLWVAGAALALQGVLTYVQCVLSAPTTITSRRARMPLPLRRSVKNRNRNRNRRNKPRHQHPHLTESFTAPSRSTPCRSRHVRPARPRRLGAS
jgi:hypothetical protein